MSLIPAEHNHQICIERALKAAQKVCECRGVRLTRLRRRILELIWNTHQAVKAYELLEQLNPNEGGVKPPTVYRSLEFLMQHGLVHRIESLNAYVGCPHPGHSQNNVFLICDECGIVNEVHIAAVNETIAAAAKKSNFRLKQQSVEVHGICSACRVVH